MMEESSSSPDSQKDNRPAPPNIFRPGGQQGDAPINPLSGGIWEKYFGTLSDEYMKTVIDYAKLSTYTIQLKIPTGRKTKNPITDEEEDLYSGWEAKEYTRNKISQRDWITLERLRAQFNTEKSPEKLAEVYAKIYEFAALRYLNMEHEEFIRTDWEEVKVIIDACNFRTTYSLPYSQGDSTTSSSSEKRS